MKPVIKFLDQYADVRVGEEPRRLNRRFPYLGSTFFRELEPDSPLYVLDTGEHKLLVRTHEGWDFYPRRRLTVSEQTELFRILEAANNCRTHIQPGSFRNEQMFRLLDSTWDFVQTL